MFHIFIYPKVYQKIFMLIILMLSLMIFNYNYWLMLLPILFVVLNQADVFICGVYFVLADVIASLLLVLPN